MNPSDVQVVQELLELLSSGYRAQTVGGGVDEKGIHRIPGYDFDKRVDAGLDAALNLTGVDSNYLERIQRIESEPISCASLEDLAAWFTWVQRGERFCWGHIAGQIEDGRLEELLHRLLQLAELSTRTTGHFEGCDLDGLWDQEVSRDEYNELPPSGELLAEVEAELGFRLPDSLVELASIHNGGVLARNCFPMENPTSWADDHIMATGLFSIGREKTYSLLGELGSTFMQEMWEYPQWGVCIADTPSAGHEMIMLDYRDCGPQGEPSVVHVDQELDFHVTFVAPDFASFIKGLVPEDVYDDSEEYKAEELMKVSQGTLSPIMVRALEASSEQLPKGEQILRSLAMALVEDKGHFSLHSDERSLLFYDLLFWLYSQIAAAQSYEDYFYMSEDQDSYERPCHELMARISLATQPYQFNTGGYAESCVREWWDEAVNSGRILEQKDGNGFTFSLAAEHELLSRFNDRSS